MTASSAIVVERLSKRYRIGRKEHQSGSLREALTALLLSPWTNFKRLRGLSHFSADDAEDVLWALDEVSFQVERGQVLGVVGRNGAGKSTLLKVLSRITPPTSGRALIRGRVASLLEVGTGFHRELTGRQNVYLNGTILGMSRKEIDASFDEIVAFSEIEPFIDTPVKRYSSGMRVRLAFAVAAHLRPEVLIVDEVLAVGDVAFQEKCIGKMNDISEQGRTILFVSHNMASVLNLCDRAILLDNGRLAMDAGVDEVVQQYVASAQMAGGEVCWKDATRAPHNDIVRLEAVRVVQPGDSNPTAKPIISKPIDIEIDYVALVADLTLFASIVLMNHQGVVVLQSVNFASMNSGTDVWCDRPRPKGAYRSVCRLPANFLNDGRYSVGVMVGKTSRDVVLYEESVVSFDVVDSGEMRKEYYGELAGTVRPRLDWRTDERAARTSADEDASR